MDGGRRITLPVDEWSQVRALPEFSVLVDLSQDCSQLAVASGPVILRSAFGTGRFDIYVRIVAKSRRE
jgi:hypothetical protein